MNKLVARFADGQIIKGMTTDVSLEKETLHISPLPPEQGWERTQVSIWDLKALFFVKDFDGDPAYTERKEFTVPPGPTRRGVEVTFHDGEVLLGTTEAYRPAGWGFLFVPADADSNNERAWIVRSATREVRYV